MYLTKLAGLMGVLGLSALPIAVYADTFTGTSGDDNIRGTNDDDEIFTGLGSDKVSGRGGDDYIEDVVELGDIDSHNVLKGGSGDDEIIGQGDEGSYTAYGNSGDDKISIGAIDMIIAYGGRGNDILDLAGDTGLEAYGGAGNDRIEASEGNSRVTIDGGSGDDIMLLSLDSGTVEGGRGEDEIRVSAEFLIVDGGPDDDTLTAVGGNEIEFFGGRGDDTFISEDEFGQFSYTGGSGADRFECGPGVVDIVMDYDPDEGDTVNEDDCEEVHS